MKKINYIVLLLALSVMSFISCEDILEADSDRLVTIDDDYMHSDSLYSMFGILYQLQKIADSYVILGELRGELLEVSEEYANKHLKEIYNFVDTYSADNPYTNNKNDYYAIINNCNYVIHNADTSIVSKGEKPMYKVIAAATAIKAWTYMQLVLNFGEAYYFDKPILNIQDALKDHSPIKQEELFPKLIAELLPYQSVDRINPGDFGGFSRSYQLFFPVRFVLGDLYLWTGQYLNAANTYRDLIYYDSYIVPYQNSWEVVGSGSTMEFTGQYQHRYNFFGGKSGYDYVTSIAVSNEFEHFTDLDSFFYNPPSTVSAIAEIAKIRPTRLAHTKFDSTLYFHDYKDTRGTTWLTTKGDLRAYFTFLFAEEIFDPIYSDYYDEDDSYVYKYYCMNNFNSSGSDDEAKEADIIVPYREVLAYLRYAEAVNRLGKPNTAMAVLKNGLNKQTLANRRLIPEHEIEGSPNYMDFNDTRFEYNIGIHARGSGYTNRDTTFYKIDLSGITEPTLQDSILFVENLIQEELVLELAYEGNRFHDLMRLAIHRNNNEYLAKIVSEKFEDTATRERVKNKLMSRENWYIK